MSTHIYSGTIVHSTDQSPIDILPNHVLGIKDGKVAFLEDLQYDKTDLGDIKREHAMKDAPTTQLSHSSFVSAGFIDTHIHAPQYPQSGTHLDLPLLEWLNNYTIPLEASYKDTVFAWQAYNKAVKRSLYNGTTTALYFATIHLEASKMLVDAVEKHGQRAWIGKVNMDQNSCDDYIEDTHRSIEDTKLFIADVQRRNNPLIEAVICPRFAPTCSDELLSGLGRLAQQHNLPVTSHICESKAEVCWVQELFPWSTDYTHVYQKHGLLTNRTVMAHGVYLSDDELDRFHNIGAAISHCPNSNASLRSGCLDLRKLLQHGVKTGLGTDVSGGYSSSILDAQRLAVAFSNVMSVQRGGGYRAVDWKEAYRLATLGGAQAMGLHTVTGNFAVNKEFDGLIVDAEVHQSPIDVFHGRDTEADVVQKFLHLGDDRNIVDVIVGGRSCKNI